MRLQTSKKTFLKRFRGFEVRSPYVIASSVETKKGPPMTMEGLRLFNLSITSSQALPVPELPRAQSR